MNTNTTLSPAARKIVDEAPEYASVEAYVEDRLDDDGGTFTGRDLQALSTVLGRSLTDVRAELESYGLKQATASRQREVRGFTSNCHNLFQSMGHHGGAGIDGTTGRATVQGRTL